MLRKNTNLIFFSIIHQFLKNNWKQESVTLYLWQPWFSMPKVEPWKYFLDSVFFGGSITSNKIQSLWKNICYLFLYNSNEKITWCFSLSNQVANCWNTRLFVQITARIHSMYVCGLMSNIAACRLLSLPLQIISCNVSLISLKYELKLIQVLIKNIPILL